jgi:hypothetical protein
MKHATKSALDELDGLLTDLRGVNGLTERTRGAFYRGSRAFLHFHEDPTGFYADVRLNGAEFERMRVSTKVERKRLLSRVRAAMRQ